MRRSQRVRRRRQVTMILVLSGVVGAGWWWWPRGIAANQAALPLDNTQQQADADRDSAPPIAFAPDNATGIGPDESAGRPLLAAITPTSADRSSDASTSPRPATVNPRITAALDRYRSGAKITARHELNQLLKESRDEAERQLLRRELTRIADETVFSKKIFDDDPLVAAYSIQAGDVLARIAGRFSVPWQVLRDINGVEPTRIRVGQKLKAPRGPFNAVIQKSAYRMDLYLQDLYVRSYPVGLGTDQGTPEGVWTVKNRLENPTFFPPAAAQHKRVIDADDPANPLGERWIGLSGIEGDAVGREGYGIHGTIDPRSIGKDASLGCVRMHNKDVAFVYTLLAARHSRVTITP